MMSGLFYRSRVSALFAVLLFTLYTHAGVSSRTAFAAELVFGSHFWEETSPGLSRHITGIKARSHTGEIYVSSEKGLFVSEDNGVSWRRLQMPGTDGEVVLFDIGKELAVLSVSGGVYVGDPGRSEWRLVRAGGGIKDGTITASAGGEGAVLWDDTRFYREIDGRLEVIGGLPAARTIDSAAFSRGKFFAVASGDLYMSQDIEDDWLKIYSVMSGAEEPADHDTAPEEVETAAPNASLRVSGDGTVAVLAEERIITADSGSAAVKAISVSGLPDSEVRMAVAGEGSIFAATSRRVYVSNVDGSWNTALETSAGTISGMEIYKDRGGKWRLVVSAGGKVYCSGAEEDRVVFARDGQSDPTVREVQKMAIEYAEVSPGKITGWRRGARWKAVLPRLSVGFAESVDDNIDIYKSSAKYYVVNGPRERGSDWSVDLTWDLSDLVWNSEQTSIDVRSRLMVQLRENILEEVTRLYFERKKTLRQIKGKGISRGRDEMNEKILRVEELTAYIDALTGGMFSEALSATRRHDVNSAAVAPDIIVD